MLYTIIAILAATAIFGMILLSYVLKEKESPKGVMVLHGLLAVTALILLLNYVFNNDAGPVEAAILFVIAALGGIVMAARDLTGRAVPKWLAIVHGLTAIVGFVFLLLFTFG